MIVLIDVSGFIYRAFYALPGLLYEGREVGALYGFCTAMRKMQKLFPKAIFVAAMDSSKKTFRNEIYAEYKANRKATPEELISQIPLIKEACMKFGFNIVEVKGFEADDIIASYASRLPDVTIISSDKDLMQLMNENTKIYDPMKQKYVTPEGVKKKFGVTPDKVLDMLSLMGDTSDNIPGVPGIGPKTASALLEKFGSLDGIIENLDALPKGKKYEILKGEIEKAILSRDLASLRNDLDVPLDLKETIPAGLDDFLLSYGFKSLVKSKNQLKFLDNSIDESNELCVCSSDIYQGFILGNKDKLKDQKILKICEDSKSLIKLCWNLGVDIQNVCDVPLMSYCIHGTSIKTDLNAMALSLLSTDLANQQKVVLHHLYRLLKKQLNEDTCKLCEIENRVTSILAKMEMRGIQVDLEYLSEIEDEFDKKISDLAEQIYKIAGIKFNLASPKQVAFTLFDRLKLPCHDKKQSTDVETLSKLVGPHENIVGKILEWRQYTKLKNTYIEALKKFADQNNRVHTTYSQRTVNTGRLSSSDPNLQNIPNRTEEGRKIRSAFVAAPGKVLVSLDYSQMELRLLAHITDCQKLLQAFHEGQDIHSKTASYVFKTVIQDVSSDQRRIAKEINFSILYGVSIPGLASRLNITKEDAEKIMEEFMGLYPEFSEYIQDMENFALKHGYVETIFKRKCFVPQIRSKKPNLVNFAKRQAINAPVQGSNADLIKLAMVKIDDLNLMGCDLLLQIHDELIFEIDENLVDENIPQIKDIMENVYPLRVPLKVDVEVTKCL